MAAPHNDAREQVGSTAGNRASASHGVMCYLSHLWPLVLGLAAGRTGLIAACYGSYKHTDEGLYTDGAMMAALCVLFLFFLVVGPAKKRLSKKWVNRIARACFAVEALTIVALGVLSATGDGQSAARFPLSVCCTIASSGAIFYWLRRSRGMNRTTIVVFTFSALIVSEVLLYALTFAPKPFDQFASAALALVQFPCIMWALATMQERENKSAAALGFTTFNEELLRSKQLLAVTGVGIGLLSVVIGLLRGFPNGDAIPFTPETRLAYGLLTIALCAGVIALSVYGRRRTLSTDIFIAMGLLASLALVLYAAFPHQLAYGAVLTTTLNALMVVFTWYIIVAFMSEGWRDPYYYALAGWFVWLGARSCSRMLLLASGGTELSNELLIAVLAAFTVVSTQVIFMLFLQVERREKLESAHEAESAAAENAGGAVGAAGSTGAAALGSAGGTTAAEAGAGAGSVSAAGAGGKRDASTLVRIMGLDGGDLTDMRRAAMRHSAEIIGEQFLLSEREVDVLALYALGFTQKRVAEELFITPSTTHAHIKRIYAKTGMHSRQEILDYISQYAS